MAMSEQLRYNVDQQPSQKWHGSKGAENTSEPLTHTGGDPVSANAPILQAIPDSANSLDLPHVEIYIDGSCEPNPGAAGIGCVLLFGQHRKEISEPIGRGTNNTSEMQAAITALMSLTKTCRVTIYSDSQYLIKTMNGEFCRSSNVDLWNDIDFAAMRHEVTWCWVKGHNGNPNNERAHRLAEASMRRNGVLA